MGPPGQPGAGEDKLVRELRPASRPQARLGERGLAHEEDEDEGAREHGDSAQSGDGRRRVHAVAEELIALLEQGTATKDGDSAEHPVLMGVQLGRTLQRR